MAVRGVALLLVGLLLAGCAHTTLEPASEANLTPRDKKLLADAPYAKSTIPAAYQRAIVQYHRKETPGSIVIDRDARYLYYVLPDNKAIRYGVIVGEEAQSWYGVAKVGRKEEWPGWTPTAENEKAARRSQLRRRRRAKSHGRPGDLSLPGRQGYAVPHPRHQPAGIDRTCDLVGLHPDDSTKT